LRDGGVCILPLFADERRRSAGDSLRLHLQCDDVFA
jgi:hypothetical protein